MGDSYLITPDIFTDKMNILIYGDPGAGKTYLAGTAQDVPSMANVHVFNIDGGIMTLASRGDIHATNIHSVDDLEQELPAFWIYVALKFDQIAKAVWCVLRLRSGKWIKKITAGNVGREN